MNKLALAIAIMALLLTSVSALKDGLDLFSPVDSELNHMCSAGPTNEIKLHKTAVDR